MAAKSNGDKVYLDVVVANLSERARAALAAQRVTYDADKAAKAALLAIMREEYPVGSAMEIAYTAYTRWGQFQAVLQPKTNTTAKTTAKRETLEQYQARMAANGQAH